MASSNWSELPPEILDLVLQRLLLLDCLAFRKVCTSWRTVFLNRRRLTRPPPCFLLTPFDGPVPRNFWGIEGYRFSKLFSPEPRLLRSQQIVGSSLGWLVIASSVEYHNYTVMYLLNPTTHKQIPLPSLASTATIIQVDLSSTPVESDCFLVARVRYKSISGIQLVWCRPSDRKWTISRIPYSALDDTCDSVLHKGKMYLLCESGDIIVCNFDPQPTISVLDSVNKISNRNNPSFMRLVRSGGEVLLVLEWSHSADGSPTAPSLGVFSFSGDEGGRWVRVENLGDRVLLLGDHGAESVSTRDLMGSVYEPNCVYYPSWYSCYFEKYCLVDMTNESILMPDFGDHRPRLHWVAAQFW